MWQKCVLHRLSLICDKNRRFLTRPLKRFLSTHHDVSLTDNSNKDKWIIPSIHPDVSIPSISLFQYVYDAQERTADKTVLINGETGQSFTNFEIRENCLRLASALARLGVSKGDTVAIVSPNCPEFCFSFFSILTLGATVTTVSSNFTADEIKWQLINSDSSAVICHKDKLKFVRKACKDNANIRFIISFGPEEEGVLSIHKLLKDDGKGIPSNIQINPENDVAVLPYSSGTTGLPKGVMLTHKNIVANLQQILQDGVLPFKLAEGNFQEIFIGILPLYHIYGMVVGMTYSMCSGTKFITLKEFIQEQFASTIGKYKATFLQTVPPIITFINNSDLITKDILSSVHTVGCGAAPIGPALIEGLFTKFGRHVNFIEGYGMTEASPVTHITAKNRFVIGSCGIAVPSTLSKIIDLVSGESIEPGAGPGELCVKGPQVMKGYYKNEKATHETLRDGWLHTGDIAQIDSDGNVFIVDRLKELIKVKGLQVAPAELEDLLRQHPAVEEVAVVGVPDDRSGEVPRAYVVLAKGKTATEEEIKAFVEKNVAPYKRLHGGVIFQKEIPKSASGKILRRELRAAAGII